MMMVFGMFVFMLRTTPYQQLQHSQEWRHVKNERVNQSAGWQYIGAGDDNITLSGVLYPEITGGNLSLSALETIGYAGRPWPLIEGTGRIYGMYVLTRLERGKSEFDRFGNPKNRIYPQPEPCRCGLQGEAAKLDRQRCPGRVKDECK
jgi:phage protein U